MFICFNFLIVPKYIYFLIIKFMILILNIIYRSSKYVLQICIMRMLLRNFSEIDTLSVDIETWNH